MSLLQLNRACTLKSAEHMSRNSTNFFGVTSRLVCYVNELCIYDRNYGPTHRHSVDFFWVALRN